MNFEKTRERLAAQRVELGVYLSATLAAFGWAGITFLRAGDAATDAEAVLRLVSSAAGFIAGAILWLKFRKTGQKIHREIEEMSDE